MCALLCLFAAAWLQLFERQYGSELEGSQIYAAHKYLRRDVKEMRPRGAVDGARPFTPDMVAVAYDGSTRRVGPYEMLPATAAGACSCYSRLRLVSPSWSALPGLLPNGECVALPCSHCTVRCDVQAPVACP